MLQKTERFEMRLDPSTLNRVDEWRAAQTDLPSRAEAMRRLVNSGLSMDERRFQPSGGERLSIAMLCGLYRHLEVDDGGIDPALIEGAVCGKHHWAVEWEYGSLLESAVDDSIPPEVANILEMWWTIEWSFDQFSADGRERLEKDEGVTQDRIRFPGFDGNEENEHYGVADFMINRLDRFVHFKGRSLNSHFPYLNEYRQMHKLYNSMTDPPRPGNHLDPEQIARLIGHV